MRFCRLPSNSCWDEPRLAFCCSEVSWPLSAAEAAASIPAGDAIALTLDERVNQLASELRCLVCQNQTVADSHAPTYTTVGADRLLVP